MYEMNIIHMTLLVTKTVVSLTGSTVLLNQLIWKDTASANTHTAVCKLLSIVQKYFVWKILHHLRGSTIQPCKIIVYCFAVSVVVLYTNVSHNLCSEICIIHNPYSEI